MASNLPRGTPGRVLLLFGLLAAGVAAVVQRDATRPGQPPAVTHPTACGDATWFPAGSPPPAFELNGQRYLLVPTGGGRFERRDDLMFAVALPVGGGLRVYTPREDFDRMTIPPLYLKSGDGEFVRVKLEQADQAP